METEKMITSLEEGKRFISDCFKALSTCEEHAKIIAENLITADYRGHYSHGMNRLSWYLNDIRNKRLNPNAVPLIEKETVATALVNGQNSLGAVVGKFSMDLAIQKAKDVGIGMVTAHNSNHYGIAGMYALQAIEEGCIGISTTNTSPVMVPTRAKKTYIGSNPISFGVPGKGGDNMVLDMATTVVALGKIEVAKRKGEQIPNGWALNEQGENENDPERASQAARLLPLGGDETTGGYKGYGMGLMLEILSGILSGANFGPNIPVWSQGQSEKANLGQCFIAINPSVFAPGCDERLKQLVDGLRQMEPKEIDKPVLIPGDPETTHMRLVDSQGGLCYVKNQHDTNLTLAHALNVVPMKYVIKS